MKRNYLACIATVAFAIAALPLTGHADTLALPGSISVDPLAATEAGPDAGSIIWSEIKDVTYDMRAQFFAGLKRLQEKVDTQVRELTAKRAAMKSTTDTKEWDFAMKEMESARDYLKGMNEELNKATPETWDQLKEKVGDAWTRTQEAYDKVRSSTTS